MTKLLLRLGPEDRRLLRGLAAHLGAPESQVLRWALRYYFVRGPWAARNVSRETLLGDDDASGAPASLDIGPSPKRRVI